VKQVGVLRLIRYPLIVMAVMAMAMAVRRKMDEV
jgi:hypothetical protein